MARSRQWYEDVMDVALRATLKEHGFRRKSHATYVCEHSPDRVWAFELALCHSPAEYFSESSGIFVPTIEEAFKRFALKGPRHTGMRTVIHADIDIGDLVEIEKGWDYDAWSRNPKSRTWFGGYRRPPSIDTVLRHIQPGGCFAYDAAGSSVGADKREWRHRVKLITEELGHDLDALWRKYELPWLQSCDDPLWFANWLEGHVPAGNLTWAVAWHVAGDVERAAAYLANAIHNKRSRMKRWSRNSKNVTSDNTSTVWRPWKKTPGLASVSIATKPKRRGNWQQGLA